MNIPFLLDLESAEHVLIAGAGGGFDVFGGLPLYFALRSAGKRVTLANLSFSELVPTAGEYLTPHCVRITPESDGSVAYFPEKYLAQFLQSRGDAASIYAFRRMGVRPVTAAYKALLQQLKFDTLVLVDGGTDSLMRGDEEGLGTPEEDATSLLACRRLSLPRKFHLCIGFGVDHYHQVCNGHAFEAIAELTRTGSFCGAFSLPPAAPEAQFYRDALAYVHERMPRHESIVNSSIVAATEGRFGNHHATGRTKGSELHLSPLMPMHWAFALDAVADRLLYRDAIRNTDTFSDVSLAIETFRAMLPSLRPYFRAVP